MGITPPFWGEVLKLFNKKPRTEARGFCTTIDRLEVPVVVAGGFVLANNV